MAATVLVFNLVDPNVTGTHGLGTALLQEWPSYAAYLISFSTIVVIWVNHHGIIDAIGRFDQVLLFLNGLLLLTVAVIPFPTRLLAHYLQAGHDRLGFSLGLGLWPLATITAFFNVTLALTLYAFVVLFYIALPITRERRTMAASSGEGGPLRLTHGDASTAEARGGDLGEDA